MRDVARARGTAGLTVASTFSGCGGSCLGFEMAGYRVLWANEFLPIACASYASNHPDTVLDGRDISTVTAKEILEAAGLRKGELDVFNGSPPCQAFSSAGQGSSGWGKEREYSNGVKQKNEDLFFEYTRLLEGLQPRAFVAENVAGLTRGAAVGMFKAIIRALAACGYSVQCKLLDAQWLGVPQTRGRAIFIGVRKDLGELPEFPAPLPYRYSLREVLPYLAKVRFDTKTSNASFRVQATVTDRPCPAILTSGHRTLEVTDRPISVPLQRNGGTVNPDAGYALGAETEKIWHELRPGRNHHHRFSVKRAALDAPSPCVMTGLGESGVMHPTEPRKFTMNELRVICSFPADFILKGTYAEQWARLGNAVPPLMMRAVAAKLRDGLFTRLGRTRSKYRDAVLDLR